MTIQPFVMTVPARLRMAEALVGELEGQRARYGGDFLSPVVSVDEARRGCWWNSRRCWQSGASGVASHVLVLSDDALVASDFAASTPQAVEARPGEAISFYCARKAVREAAERGEHWVGLNPRDWLNGIAVCLPRQLAADFLAWCAPREAEHADRWRYHDDVRLQDFLKAHTRRMWVTAPSLVDHADVPSVIGHSKAPGGRPRVAALFQAHDTRYIDWSR